MPDRRAIAKRPYPVRTRYAPEHARRRARSAAAAVIDPPSSAMGTLEVLLLLCSGAFALNMGGSGLAPAFSVALGANLISRRLAALVYGLCVIVGALVLGQLVAKTLAGGFVPPEELTRPRVLCVLAAATASLFLANLLKVPQSTSWVTVFALVAAGLHIGHLEPATLWKRLLPAWLAMPMVAFVVTYGLLRILYPLRPANFRLHERIRRNDKVLRWFVLGTSGYVAMAIGSNNVGNVVGPLAAAGVVGVDQGLLYVAPLFGFGALLFQEPAKTVGKSIVPIGPVAASLVSLVVGTLLLVASSVGIPQSLVQLNAAAVVAVWRVKEDAGSAAGHPVLRRILLLWLITPIISVILTTLLLGLVE